jgi:hypothetical protein
VTQQRTRNGSKKALTLKDVFYALEYAGERLGVTYDRASKPHTQYHLFPSGHVVGAKTAEKAINSADVVAVEDGLFPGCTQTYQHQTQGGH